MAISVMNWVWDHSRSRHGARLVLLALADCARDDGTAWPSVPELKRKTGLGDRAVQAALIDLAKLGELDVGYQQGPKGCNRYRLLMPRYPADIAGAQSLRGADIADPPQELRGSETSSQVSPQDPAEIADPADSAPPPQNSTPDPADSAGGTIRDPSGSSKPSSRQKRDLNEGRDDAMRLCVHLADRVELNTEERPKIGKQWLDSARLMLDNDHRTEEQIHRAIDWCQDDEFWRKNVRAMPTLRKQYIRLRMEAEEQRKRNANGHRGAAPAPGPDRARSWVAAGEAFQARIEQSGKELP